MFQERRILEGPRDVPPRRLQGRGIPGGIPVSGFPGRVDLGGCPPKSPTDPGLHITEIRCQFIILARKDEPTSRKKARERGIVGSLKPFRWNPAGNQSRPVEPDQQPEASLAWWVGDHPYKA